MRIALIYSRQPANQYIGGSTGVDDSENAWMYRLAQQIKPLLEVAGVAVEMPENTDYNRSGSISYADNVAWVADRHRIKAFDLLISLHSNALGNACILYGTSTASRNYALAFQSALNAAKLLPYGDTWELNDKKVSEVADTPPPALLLEVGQHDRTDYADWLRTHITDGSYARGLVAAFLTALGVEKPAPVEPPPVVEPKTCPTCGQPWPVKPPTPEPVKTVDFKLGVANLHGYGGNGDYKGRGLVLRDELACSILVLNETYPEEMRNEIRAILGPTWKVWVHEDNTLCVMWDSSKWEHVDRAEVDFGDSFHGALRVGLRNIRTGLLVDIISVHVRPKSVASPEQKAADVAKAATLYRGRQTYMAGDFALDAPVLPGWERKTPAVDTMPDRLGTQSVDIVYTRGGAKVRYATLIKPTLGDLDHDAWVIGGTLTELRVA